MFNLSGSEIVIILLLALVVLGPEKLPDAIRRFGKVYGELRKMSRGFQSEFKQAFDEPVREIRETARLTKEAVTGLVDEAATSGSATTPTAGNASSSGESSSGDASLSGESSGDSMTSGADGPRPENDESGPVAGSQE